MAKRGSIAKGFYIAVVVFLFIVGGLSTARNILSADGKDEFVRALLRGFGSPDFYRYAGPIVLFSLLFLFGLFEIVRLFKSSKGWILFSLAAAWQVLLLVMCFVEGIAAKDGTAQQYTLIWSAFVFVLAILFSLIQSRRFGKPKAVLPQI